MKQEENQIIESKKKDISARVLYKIEAFRESGELKIPKDYSPENALKSAYLILLETKNRDNKFALEYCTPESVANALLKMVVWGLSPLKKQCDFIMYGEKLDCSIEYTGNIVLAKRYGGLKNIKANAIFDGDNFEFEVDPTTGRKKIIKHQQTLESIGTKNLKGAYAVYEKLDGTIDVEVMNIHQIIISWKQGPTKGDSPAHRNFPDQMAIKTVINRACKLLIRGSDDSALYAGGQEDEKIIDVDSSVDEEIRVESNKEVLDFDTVEDAQIVEETPKAPF